MTHSRSLKLRIGAIAFAAACVIASIAAASAFTNSSAQLAAGDDPVGSCDTDFVVDGFTLNGSQQITAITISGIASACVGGELAVDLTRTDNVSVGSGGPVLVTDTLPLTVPIPDAPAASLVKHEVIIIVGP